MLLYQKLESGVTTYITAEMRELIRTRNYLKKKANKAGSKYLHQAFQQIRNKVKYRIRKLRSEYYRNKIEENRGDLKATWKILKEVTNKGNKSTDINEVLFEGEKITNAKIIPDAFNHHFASIGGKSLQARFPSLRCSPVIICQKLANLRLDLDSRKFI